ncbi:MAG: hypothetical protein EGR16_01340 [Clostridiales bacterium]|nr:hypothetical protein [Clostridiales bacterium]
MSELTNRASYLQGLAEGLKLDTDKTEGKLIGELLNLVSDMANELESLDDEQAFVADKLDEMEDVIDVIGENVFGDDYDDDDDDVYTIVCDNCGAEIDFTGDDLDDIASGDFVCPECGKTIELDFDECECDCGCDHDHDHE